MPFEPNKISKEHVLRAIGTIKQEKPNLKDSTVWDVVIDGASYPPKEVMRYAHREMNGEYLWNYPGGDATNNRLKKFGFKIVKKSNIDDPILNLIERYKEHARQSQLKDELYKWRLVKTFNGRPNTNALDFTQELINIKFGNLIYPAGIAVIQNIAKTKPEDLREAFKLLFNEEVALVERLSNFKRKTLDLYREVDPKSNFSHHQDERTMATYLAFHDSSKYAFYKDSFYQKYCKLIGEKPARTGEKYGHYLSLLRGFVENYILEDSELLDIKMQLLTDDCYEDLNNNIFAQDILYSTLDHQKGWGRNYWRFGVSKEETNTWNAMQANQYISIGWSEIGDLSERGIQSKKEVVQLLASQGYYSNDPKVENKIAGEIFNFFSDIQEGDIILAQDGAEVLGIGEALGEYRYNSAQDWPHIRPVQWNLFSPEISNSEGLNSFVFKISQPVIIQQIDNLLADRKNEQKMNNELNQILFGPPGTGKTFHTINKALEIIDGSAYDENTERSELLKRFNQLKEEGRIGFVTFHQSFSYEDFVEGITPQLVQNEDANQTENEDTSQTENGEVKYELKEGMFKRLSRMAGGVPIEKVNKEHQYDFDNARFFKMSIGGKQKPHIHDWCIKNGKIGLGWGGDANFQQLISSVGNWREFRDRFKVEYPHLVEESKFHVQAMHAFLKMRKGDVVLVSKGNHIIDAVGVIKDDDYIYDDQQDFGYYQFRNIDWIASNLNASPELFVSKKISQQTIYEFFDEDIKRESFKKTFNSDQENSSPENYVLIIDEINRGNVAAIFGELITLIEPDKRLGNAEALQAQLPYSKDWFGVPANLYIVGTMNTADRSVEALDTALRRRFSFEEMLPKPALIKKHGVSGGIIEGIDLEEILTVINDRIEALIDRDHTIGHSYFMTVNSENDLRLVFKDKIVPLLQEYFFGDFGKIGLVLGSEFVEKVPEVTRFAVIDGYEDIAYLQKERFRLKPINDEFPIIKALSLLLGKTDQQG